MEVNRRVAEGARIKRAAARAARKTVRPPPYTDEWHVRKARLAKEYNRRKKEAYARQWLSMARTPEAIDRARLAAKRLNLDLVLDLDQIGG